jgi:hypothetical protein
MDDILQQTYYNPTTGFQSAPKLYEKLKHDHPKLTLKYTKEWIAKQYVDQITRQRRKPISYSKILSYGPGDIYQIDLMIYNRFAWQHYKYILVIVDVYSRLCYAIALTNRKAEYILDAIKTAFKKLGIPTNINADNEFNNNIFNKYWEENNIKTYFSQPDQLHKNAIVERMNRTIATMIQKYRQSTKDYNWPAVLPKLITNYNTTVHSTTKQTPNDIFFKDAPPQDMIDHIPATNAINIGAQVRTLTKKKIFDKGDKETYSRSIYTVTGHMGNKYKVKNNDSGHELKTLFKIYELQVVNEVQQPPTNSIDDEKEHIVVQRQIKQTRTNKKEGINKKNIRKSTREKAPRFNIVDNYGQVLQ